MPFRLFWIYLRALDSEFALERVQMTRSVMIAIESAFSKSQSGIPGALRKDLRDSFQE